MKDRENEKCEQTKKQTIKERNGFDEKETVMY
jgi:hypothetical protein